MKQWRFRETRAERLVAVHAERDHETSISDPTRIVAAVRARWAVENRLRWTLDVTFREDASRPLDVLVTYE